MTSRAALAGRYELGNRLGRGGMGDVWRAFDTVLRRDVAVKTVDLDLADDPATRERFQREAMATASLSHVNVVTVYDAGIDGSTAYLVMELLPGPTLAALVSARGALSVDLAIEYAVQAATALAAAHAVGVIHRDVKPSNLMLDSSGQLKMVDFGIARLTQSHLARLTATDATLGSATYMAPEQARGEPASESTDIYALGCVLMTLLTGEPPFTADHPVAVLQQQLHSPPPRVLDRRPDVPEALGQLVGQMLAKEPSARPPDANSVRVALEHLRDDGPSHTSVRTVPAALPGIGAVGSGVPDGQPPITQTRALPVDSGDPRSRRTGVAVVAALAIVIVIVGLMWVVNAMSDDGTGREAGTSNGSSPRQTSSSGPSQTTPSQTTPSETTASETTPPSDGALAAAVADLRSAVESLPAADEEQERGKDKLIKDLEKIETSLGQGSEELERSVEHFVKTLDDLAEKGEIDSSGQQTIEDALDALEELVDE